MKATNAPVQTAVPVPIEQAIETAVRKIFEATKLPDFKMPLPEIAKGLLENRYTMDYINITMRKMGYRLSKKITRFQFPMINEQNEVIYKQCHNRYYTFLKADLDNN